MHMYVALHGEARDGYIHHWSVIQSPIPLSLRAPALDCPPAQVHQVLSCTVHGDSRDWCPSCLEITHLQQSHNLLGLIYLGKSIMDFNPTMKLLRKAALVESGDCTYSFVTLWVFDEPISSSYSVLLVSGL